MSITAIAPYKYDGLNFKDKAFNGWKNANFPFTNGFYPRILHSILFRYDIFNILIGDNYEKNNIYFTFINNNIEFHSL